MALWMKPSTPAITMIESPHHTFRLNGEQRVSAATNDACVLTYDSTLLLFGHTFVCRYHTENVFRHSLSDELVARLAKMIAVYVNRLLDIRE